MDSPQFVVVTNGLMLTAPNFTTACLWCDRHYQTFGVNRAQWPANQSHPHYVGHVLVMQGDVAVAKIDHENARWLVEEYDVWEAYYANKERVSVELEQTILEHFWDAFATGQVALGFAHMVTVPCHPS